MSACPLPIEWHLEKRKIKDLKDFSKNPRKMTTDQAERITESLKKFGLVDKPFINLDNTIIGGHQRLRILKKLGHKEVVVHVPDRPLSEEEVEELNLRHNKNTAEWDYDILANNYEMDDLLRIGFTAEELQLGQDEPEEGEEVHKDEAVSQIGCTYKIGASTIVCGDSLCEDHGLEIPPALCDEIVKRYIDLCYKKDCNPEVFVDGEDVSDLFKHMRRKNGRGARS